MQFTLQIEFVANLICVFLSLQHMMTLNYKWHSGYMNLFQIIRGLRFVKTNSMSDHMQFLPAAKSFHFDALILTKFI